MRPIEPCVESELLMERVRRDAREMDRDDLLTLVDCLSVMYAKQKAVGVWLATEATNNLLQKP